MTDGTQNAESKDELILKGAESRANLVSRSVIRGDSNQDFYVQLTAMAKCFGDIIDYPPPAPFPSQAASQTGSVMIRTYIMIRITPLVIVSPVNSAECLTEA
mgnify:CR=1 FL=1